MLHARAALAAFILLAGGNAVAGDAPPRGAKPVRSLLELRDEKLVRQHWDLSCGAAAIATILTYQLNDPVSEREVALDLLHRTSPVLVRARLGFSLLDLKHYAESRGFAAVGYGDLSLADLAPLAPAIVPIRESGFDHFVVFRGRVGAHVFLADPAFGNRTMTESTFGAVWANRIAFVVFSPSEPHPPNRMGIGTFALPSDETIRAATGRTHSLGAGP